MGTELIEIETPDKLLLPGLLYEPAKKTKRVAIYLHGMGSSIFYTVNLTKTLASELTKKGISYLAFNNRGAHLIQKVRLANKRKKSSKIIGMTNEQIKDCIKDVDGVIDFVTKRGYGELYLIGHSTGANKICVYNFYKASNMIRKYVLLGGGDDTGLAYDALGKKQFFRLLKKAQTEIKKGNGDKLIEESLYGGDEDNEELFTYKAVFDIMNPDGDYNIFPFLEYMTGIKLSNKPLFRHYKSIKRPTLVVYGSQDKYCYGKVPQIISILKAEASMPKEFTFKTVHGADHSFYGKEKELARLLANWL